MKPGFTSLTKIGGCFFLIPGLKNNIGDHLLPPGILFRPVPVHELVAGPGADVHKYVQGHGVHRSFGHPGTRQPVLTDTQDLFFCLQSNAPFHPDGSTGMVF
jgi:hypothetical protein